MLVLRKSDWNHQKPCIILFLVHKPVQKRGQQSLKRPAIDDRRPTPNPTNKLFQQTLNKQFDSPLLPDRYPIVYPFPGVTGFSAFAPDISAHSVPSAPDSVQSFWPEALRLGELSD